MLYQVWLLLTRSLKSSVLGCTLPSLASAISATGCTICSKAGLSMKQIALSEPSSLIWPEACCTPTSAGQQPQQAGSMHALWLPVQCNFTHLWHS